MSQSILVVQASMRQQYSQTRILTREIVDHFMSNTGAVVVERDLAQGIPLINEPWIEANFTQESARTATQRAVLSRSDALVAELQSADIIVIGLPIYNFGPPAALKAWIDQICRARLTFEYTESGPVGLLQGKRAVIAVASGGTRLGTEIDHVTQYIRHVMGFIGISNVDFVNASGMGRSKETVWQRAIKQVNSL